MTELATGLLHLTTPAATDALAASLAPRLGVGDAVLLHGVVGAGKSHLARALIRARAGEVGDIPSPTFTLVQTYPAEDLEIWHLDLYRLSDVQEVEELGLADALTDALCLIEWPDRLGPLRPTRTLDLRLELGEADTARVLHWATEGDGWDAVEKILTEGVAA
ncbi:MAG: tRNA (adenosine(37)-N6)-threonylcarbamoyltransferase complex ATPase subunit type 1 TsaE [Pseudomonadota bacterium]